MKLLEVGKILKISIEMEELSVYLNALDKVITDNNNKVEEINTLKQFSIELTKIIYNARDY